MDPPTTGNQQGGGGVGGAAAPGGGQPPAAATTTAAAASTPGASPAEPAAEQHQGITNGLPGNQAASAAAAAAAAPPPALQQPAAPAAAAPSAGALPQHQPPSSSLFSSVVGGGAAAAAAMPSSSLLSSPSGGEGTTAIVERPSPQDLASLIRKHTEATAAATAGASGTSSPAGAHLQQRDNSPAAAAAKQQQQQQAIGGIMAGNVGAKAPAPVAGNPSPPAGVAGAVLAGISNSGSNPGGGGSAGPSPPGLQPPAATAASNNSNHPSPDKSPSSAAAQQQQTHQSLPAAAALKLHQEGHRQTPQQQQHPEQTTSGIGGSVARDEAAAAAAGAAAPAAAAAAAAQPPVSALLGGAGPARAGGLAGAAPAAGPPLPGRQQQQQQQHPHLPAAAGAASHLQPPHPQPGGGPPPQRPHHQHPPSLSGVDYNHAHPPHVQSHPGAGGAPPPPPQQQQLVDRGMRELRVEDALLYLDHVKMEFKDRPQIYNQFLAIMKNFKSQEVDTPGVIRRVSKLFRGYNNLILGFNTFLPDGFKISLADLQREEREERAREEAAAAAAIARDRKLHQPNVPPAVAGVGSAGPPQQQQQQQAPQQRPLGGPLSPAAGPPVSSWNRPPFVEEPAASAQQQREPPRKAAAAQKPSPQQQPKPPPAAAAAAVGASKPPPTARGGGPALAKPLPPGAQQQAPPPHQTVEFDHAISYVTTIKRRFANDPSTYHQFLEILHTYQKEQRGIKEVLEQVAHLFQDHPDLLKEFTFFLPDAVQEQAKERLHRAAAESESRQALQRKQQMEQYQQSLPPASRPAGAAPPAAPVASAAAAGQPPPPTGSHQKFIDMTQRQVGPPAPETADARGRKRPLEVHHAAAAAPEANVYNSAVERQFFDAAREALSSYPRDGGQAWAEFLKCMDMYAQDILSRSEMLNFVEPLLGKRNNKLFEEFKRILAAAGSPTQPLPLLEDSWHSVPLSEIDFSRCRRCSPSYRALPRDYPAPPCSDRSELETKILNDIWVSLPVGSEESYTFRHMRRNTYEETLFRVEDERFEIDMVIDSNAATLHRLEPIAEEIAQLSQEELALPDLGTKPSVDGAGLGGRRFQYSFDKKILGVIHRNTIARIYGDSGQEMLDLMVKNPTVAIPLVVERLRQKDVEWRAVRFRLNRNWMELSQHNYYKSLDHRSLTWRTTDKRATSTRTLISEIKDRAANDGKEGREALKQKLDKAKEEHGTFYEVTMREHLTYKLDLTFLPKPDRRLFTPHLSLMYDNNSWAQRDAYRILIFALERGHITPADKERCHRLWTDFLGPFFGLPLNWMQQPAVAYQESTAVHGKSPTPAANTTVVSEDDDDDSIEEDTDLGGNVITEELRQQNIESDAKEKGFTDHHPLPAGANVSTLYGEGKIIKFRRSDHLYVVQLGSGMRAYLRPATVFCSILPVEKSPYTRQLRANDLSKLARSTDHLVIGSQALYLFFRLHQILIRRLNIAKRLAYSVGGDRSLKTLVEQPSKDCSPQADGKRRYEAFLSLVYNLLDGGGGNAAEGGKYEDRVRGLLGHGGYELATMDKLISHLWKNLQNLVGDETMWNLIQLYRRHVAAGSFQPEAFRQEAAYHSEGEPMYAFQYCPVQGQDSSVLHFEYLGTMEDPEGFEDLISDDVEMADAEGGGGGGGASETGGAEAAAAAAEPASKRARR